MTAESAESCAADCAADCAASLSANLASVFRSTPTGSARKLEREVSVCVGEGERWREWCDGHWTCCSAEDATRTNDEECEVGAERGVRAAAIWRAIAVREIDSRASPEV